MTGGANCTAERRADVGTTRSGLSSRCSVRRAQLGLLSLSACSWCKRWTHNHIVVGAGRLTETSSLWPVGWVRAWMETSCSFSFTVEHVGWLLFNIAQAIVSLCWDLQCFMHWGFFLEKVEVEEHKERTRKKREQKRRKREENDSGCLLCFMILQFGAVPGTQSAGSSTPPSHKLLAELNCLFVTLRYNISYL